MRKISLNSRTNTSAEHIRFVNRLEALKKRASMAGLRVRVDEDDFMLYSKPRSSARELFEDEQGTYIVSSNNIDKLEAFVEGFALVMTALDTYAGIDAAHIKERIGMRKTMEALIGPDEEENDDD